MVNPIKGVPIPDHPKRPQRDQPQVPRPLMPGQPERPPRPRKPEPIMEQAQKTQIDIIASYEITQETLGVINLNVALQERQTTFALRSNKRTKDEPYQWELHLIVAAVSYLLVRSEDIAVIEQAVRSDSGVIAAFMRSQFGHEESNAMRRKNLCEEVPDPNYKDLRVSLNELWDKTVETTNEHFNRIKRETVDPSEVVKVWNMHQALIQALSEVFYPAPSAPQTKPVTDTLFDFSTSALEQKELATKEDAVAYKGIKRTPQQMLDQFRHVVVAIFRHHFDSNFARSFPLTSHKVRNDVIKDIDDAYENTNVSFEPDSKPTVEDGEKIAKQIQELIARYREAVFVAIDKECESVMTSTNGNMVMQRLRDRIREEITNIKIVTTVKAE